MGGCIAQAFAGVYPDRAQALAVIDSTAWYGPTAPKDWRERAATAATKGLAALSAFQATRWVSDAFREAHAEVVRKHMDVFLANDVDCYRATCEMLGDADLRHYQASLRMPRQRGRRRRGLRHAGRDVGTDPKGRAARDAVGAVERPPSDADRVPGE